MADYELTSNIFEFEEKFESLIKNLDFYKISGIASYPPSRRYKEAGKCAYSLDRIVKGVFVPYLPYNEDSLLIGFHKEEKPPLEKEIVIDQFKVILIESVTIKNDEAGRHAITELLNKTKSSEIQKDFWAYSKHVMLKRDRVNFRGKYKQRDLWLFRGVFFLYRVLQDGRIILTLDTTTHFVDSKSILDEIKDIGSYKTMSEELKAAQLEKNRYGKNSRGLTFYYALGNRNVTIDSVGSVSIGKQVIGDETVYDYIKKDMARKGIREPLDIDQLPLLSGKYSYAPQFLHRTLTSEDIPLWIREKEVFLKSESAYGKWDSASSASNKSRLIEQLYAEASFDSLRLGKKFLRINRRVTVKPDRLEIPNLKIKGNLSVSPNKIMKNLWEGFFEPVRIDEVFLFTESDGNIALSFYEDLVKRSEEVFGTYFPKKPIILPKNIAETKQTVKNYRDYNQRRKCVLISILSDHNTNYKTINGICYELGIPSKNITIRTLERIRNDPRRSRSILDNTIPSLLSRAGGIPWTLDKPLNYDRYLAVDVGRSISEAWGIGVVYNKNGSFRVGPSDILKGEDLDEDSINKAIASAVDFNELPETLIYLRDGTIPRSEIKYLMSAMESYPEIKNLSVVSFEKANPYRLFRLYGNSIKKPKSGDILIQTENEGIICFAGEDEYSHGTPKPANIRIEPLKGTVSTIEVFQDLFSMSYLNWGSPSRSYSKPAPLHVIDDLVKELGLGIKRYGTPF